MAYWLAEQHLSLNKDSLEYRGKLYNYFRSIGVSIKQKK